MKKSNHFIKAITLSLLVIFSFTIVNAQTTLVKANNASCYYYTGAGSVFTWSGGSLDGYCHGYGTIQWYDNKTASFKYIGGVKKGKNDGYGTSYYANGNKMYEGYWENDMRNGYGTSYDENGVVTYQGYYDNDQYRHKNSLNDASGKLADALIDNVFFGGTDATYRMVKCVYNTSDEISELRIRVTFYGNVNTSNYYACTLVIKNTTPIFTDLVDCNERVKTFLKDIDDLATAGKLYNLLDSIFN